MEESSGGQPSCPDITNLKNLIKKVKEQYKISNPNDDRWLCPFCFSILKTLVQCNIHINKDHQNITKNHKKDFFSKFYTETKSKIQENSKSAREKLSRKCKDTNISSESN